MRVTAILWSSAKRVDQVIMVSDGERHIGTISSAKGGCTLYDAAGNVLGRYRRRVDAMRALRDFIPIKHIRPSE